MQSPDLRAIAAAASQALGADIRLACALQAGADELDCADVAAWRVLPEGPRRDDWLGGRVALSRARLQWLGERAQAAPGLATSLTHAGGLAVAVACIGAVAVGVDFEPWRASVDPRAARFFLTAVERRWAAQLAPAAQSRALLRLWTVKEALFKATPDNTDVLVGDFALDDPAAGGGAVIGPHGEDIRYVSFELAAGPLAVAACKERADVAV